MHIPLGIFALILASSTGLFFATKNRFVKFACFISAISMISAGLLIG